MRRRSTAGAVEPSPDRPGQRWRPPYPVTPHQPRIPSPSIASGSPWPSRRYGEPLKPPPARSTSRLSAGQDAAKGRRLGALSIACRSIGHREDGLATRVFDLARPGLLHVLHDVGRHRNVIEFFSHLAAVLVGP